MARFCPFFSGSTGNCCFVGDKESGVLVDAGVSAKRILTAMDENGISKDSIKAVFITHEHNDHIKGLAVLSKILNVPVVASAQTLDAVLSAVKMPSGVKMLQMDKDEIEIDGICARRFTTSHDCAGSGGYSFLLPAGQRISVCTDLGIVTDEVRKGIADSNLVMLESNHDLKMLKNGPYPPLLKVRVMSDKGHLSNNACSAELPELLKNGTTRFVLGHISRQNNTVQLALTAAKDALTGIAAKQDEDYILTAAPADGGKTIYI